MAAVLFDTLKLAKNLEAGGFTVEQAQAAAGAFADIAASADVATKADLRDLEQRLTIRLGGILVVSVGVLLASIWYLPAH